jgi:hypothetical protein
MLKIIDNRSKFDFRTKFKEGLQPLDTGHNIHTPYELCLKILNSIGPNTNQTFGVILTIEFVIVLLEDYKINPQQITLFGDSDAKEKIAYKLGINYNNIDMSINSYLTFDVVLGNPPFNTRDADDNTKTKVSGKTGLFKDFAKNCIQLVKPDGFFCFITPKQIIKTLQASPFNTFELIELSYMSEKDYWKYNTCYFILKNNGTGIKIKISDKIFNKFIDIEFKNTFNNSGINQSDLELVRDENAFGAGKKVVRFLPGSRGDTVTYDLTTSTKATSGPAVIVTALDSFASITATDELTLVGTSTKFYFNTMEEAEKIKLFLKNNALIRFVKKKFKMKKSIAYFKAFKKFNVSQIITGHEYPIEYNLTNAEIREIEDTVRKN